MRQTTTIRLNPEVTELCSTIVVLLLEKWITTRKSLKIKFKIKRQLKNLELAPMIVERAQQVCDLQDVNRVEARSDTNIPCAFVQ